jgi:hypothetical protein
MSTWQAASAVSFDVGRWRNMKRRAYDDHRSRWIRAKYAGRCHCGRRIRPGEKALWFPASKKLSCSNCGHVDALRISRDDLRAALKLR